MIILTSFSEEYEKKSKEIFTSQKIKTKNSINLISAIKYIFSSKVDNDFSNEINYLFENDVLPKRNKRLELSMIEKESNEKDYWKVFQERIEKLYNEVNNKFKNDPLYTQIMKYFNELAQAKKTDKLKVVPEKIQFYEEYVDNFPYFKQVFIMGREVKEYLKILDLENNSLEKLQLINGLQKYLIPNHENYQKYYEEWKVKYKNLVVKDYELQDLLKDLEKLIPKEEVIEISKRDKRNFNLILYLFQTDYFLKDYL